MDSFELNKILGAILGTALVMLALNITANAIFTPPKPEKPGYDIPVPEQAAPGKAGPAEPEQPLEALLATSDPKRGEATAKQCLACHTFEKGGPNRVGPNLWGVINRPRASVPGFNYSAAMKSKGGVWTYEELYKYLQKPNAMVPGTTMTFAGIPRANQRADLINYLHTLADNPPPLPTKAADSGGQDPSGAPQQGAQPAQAAQPARGQPANAGAHSNAPQGQAPKPQ
jgi:cytochrome c